MGGKREGRGGDGGGAHHEALHPPPPEIPGSAPGCEGHRRHCMWKGFRPKVKTAGPAIRIGG